MIVKNLVVVGFLLWASLVHAQQLPDSLDHLQGNERIDALNRIATNNFPGDINSTELHARRAMELSEASRYMKGLADAQFSMGRVQMVRGELGDALSNWTDALEQYEQLEDLTGIASTTNNLGVIYYQQGHYDKAMERYLKALNIREELGDSTGVAASVLSIANVRFQQQEYDKALQDFRRAMRMLTDLGNSRLALVAMNNIASIYRVQGKLNEALGQYLLCEELAETLGDGKAHATALTNMGSVYVLQGQPARALEYFERSLAIKEKISDQPGIALTLGNIGEMYQALGNHRKAIDYCQRSLEIAQPLQLRDILKEAYELLARSHAAVGNYQAAYEYHLLYSQTKDSLFNAQNSQALARLEQRFQTEQRQKEIELLKKDQDLKQAELDSQQAKLNERKYLLYAAGAGGLLLIALAFLLFGRSRIKQRSNVILRKQNKLIVNKNKNITDSLNYAKRIQNAVLVSDEVLRSILPDHFVLFKPKEIVSGDFYWAYRTPSGKAMFAVVDCTGHGVPGAFMSMIGSTFLNQVIIESGVEDPATVLDGLRDRVINALGQTGAADSSSDGMELSLCCFDPETRELRFAGANHSLFHISGDAINTVQGDYQPIGYYIGKNEPFKTQTIQLQEGDMVYAGTDGYADQFDESGKKFKNHRLRDLMFMARNKPVFEQRQLLLEAWRDWKGNADQIDDVCILGIRVP